MSDASAPITVEHFDSSQRWTAADRMHSLVTSGVTQVSLAPTDTGFVLSYPASRAPAKPPEAAA